MPNKIVGLRANSPTDNVEPQNNTLASNQIKSNTIANTGYNTDGGNSTSPTPPTPTYTPPTPLVHPQPQVPSYGGLIGSLLGQASQPSQAYIDAQNEAARVAQQQADLTRDFSQKRSNIQGTAGFLTQATGLEGLLQQQYNTSQAGLSSQYQAATGRLAAANTQQQIQQQGLTSAAGFAQPVQVPYSNQFVSPITGQGVMGEVGGSLQDALNNIIPKLKSGQMTYNDAVNALSGYGQMGMNALQAALPPGFNIAQSNTLAAQQGQIRPAYDFAKAALDRLQQTVQKLGFGQGTNIPVVNAIGDWFSRTFGVNSQQTREYNQAVAEARNAYAQLLAASRGGTPTEYGNQAIAAIPDNATPNDIAAAIQSLESLGGAKVKIYGNPGASGTGSSQLEYNPDGTLKAVSF